FAPTDRTVTSTQVHGATFTWNAGASPNVEWIVVANGGTPASPVLATGTSASGTATATGLTANTEYTAFFRGLCDDQGVGDDPSAWSGSGLNFRTQVGCGGGYDLFPTTANAGYPANTDSTITICPDNAGDVVTLTMTKFSFGWADQGLVGLFVHNGPTTGAPIFNSGQPAKTSGANTLPAGAYWGNAYSIPGGVIPGPFTSTDPSGCLTLHFRSWSTATYDTGMESDITCGPAPACSTPDNVAISNIGSTTATISWGNASGTCIVEYGPTGFTPGTGATAGTNGTVVSGLTSPANLSGLNAITSYDVYVRQVCDGPSYSANSFKAWFSTSMDCGTAIDISCGINQVQAFDGSTGDAAYHSSQFTGAPTCFAGYSAGVGGQTFLYKLTAAISGDYQLNFTRTSGTGDEYFLTAPAEDGCAAPAFTCIGGSYYIQEQTYATSHATGSYTFHLDAGDHYILMKGNPSVKTVSFNVLCPGIPLCVANPTFPTNGNSLAVNATPIAFSWPAAFGATGYDVYFQGNLVASNYPNTTISDNAYTTANMAALFGLGSTITWRVVPKNSYGTASCPTNWTFTVGGNGSTNAIPLTEGVAQGGNNFAANGYSNQNSTFWGNDAWYAFTASECGDSAVVNLCLPASQTATSVMMEVRRASDNVVVFPPADNPTYYGYTASGACFQYSYYDYNISNWVYENPKFEVSPGETYYVIVDSYGVNYNFTVAYNEISNSPDSDEDGILDCADSCPFTPGQEGDVCDAGPAFTTGRIIGCECVGGNMAVISITTDADPGQLTWEVTNESSQVVASGAPTQANTTENSTVFLAGTCYGFAVYDSNGDGIANGGWELRTTDGKVILRDEFSTGSSSPVNPPLSGSYGNYHSFCLPLAAPDVHPAECDVFDNRSDNKVFANKVAGTNYLGGTLNYQFEFSDPDSGFIRRIKKPRNYIVFSELNPSPLKGGK
ncbi:MAG: hypothetical protein J5I62_05045, partial [Flavobacteriales bacterium]|nr:hypothetical protein [Flavobacteriales bacterium]